MKSYKYRFLSRPMDTWSCPMDNFIMFHEDPEYRKFGIVEYSKPLPIEKARHYDLAPLFLDYDGKGIIVFEDWQGTITMVNNQAGQLFFKIDHPEYGEVVIEVWHKFLLILTSGAYSLVSEEHKELLEAFAAMDPDGKKEVWDGSDTTFADLIAELETLFHYDVMDNKE